MSPRLARGLAWSIVGMFFLLAAAGLTLQSLAGRPYVYIGVPGLAVLVLLVGAWPLTGALIVSRHPGHPVGWLLCLGILAGSIDMFAAGYAAYDTLVHAGALPGADLAIVWLAWGGLPIVLAAFTWLVLLFPNSRLPSPGSRRVARIAAGAMLLYILLEALEPGPTDSFYLPFRLYPLGVSPWLWVYLSPVRWSALAIELFCYAAALVAFFFRLRQARGDERQQFKWLLIPAFLFAISMPMIIVGLDRGNPWLDAGIAISLPAIAGIPIATAFAVFRYRLYDVDLIINRTLVYGLLTGVLALVYLGSVVLLQTLVSVVAGQGQPAWVTALSTLVAAAVFTPARQRVQRFIDRRFYRARYDAARTLAQFGASCQHEMDLEVLEGRLLDVVDETIQPSHVSLWRPDEPARRRRAFREPQEC